MNTTKKYVRNVRRELETARQRGLQIFVIYSPELNTGEHIELERRFAGCNVIKTITRHIDTSLPEKEIYRQVNDLFEDAKYVDDINEFNRDHNKNDIFVIIANRAYLLDLFLLDSNISK